MNQLNHLENSLKTLKKAMEQSKLAMDGALKNIPIDKRKKVNEFVRNNKSTDINYITKKVKKLLEDADNNK